jgi:hypothetical protein
LATFKSINYLISAKKKNSKEFSDASLFQKYRKKGNTPTHTLNSFSFSNTPIFMFGKTTRKKSIIFIVLVEFS